MWCAVRARENTTHIPKGPGANGPVPGTRVSPYNAAASANMAIWFFFWVWVANTFRAYRPQYFLPSIIFSIFINVTGTYGTQFATMDEAEALIVRLFEAFFAGFGISAAVSLFVIPFNSRDIIKTRILEDIHALKALLEAQSRFIVSLPTRTSRGIKHGSGSPDAEDAQYDRNERRTPWPEADEFEKAITKVADVQLTVQSELRYAAREVAWGKLGAEDFESVCGLLKNILFSVFGVESVVQATDRVERSGGWESYRSKKADASAEPRSSFLEGNEAEQWRSIITQLQGPVQKLTQAMIDGLDHSLYNLELAKRPASTRSDVESKGLPSSPGENDFATHLEAIIQDFLYQREGPLKEWCASNGINNSPPKDSTTPIDLSSQRHQSQLCLVLNLEYSLLATSRSILDLVKFANSKIEDGSMTKNRLILPGWKRTTEFFWAALSREDNNLDYEAYSTRSGTVTVRVRDAVQTGKDAEHLPPASVWEKLTDHLRGIPHFFGSPESAFGFRVAVGTMVIAIVCYLRNSQQFYIEQRMIWASIMVAVSMTQTAGSGIYGQFLRFAGTAVAMVASYIDWYIVNQHTAGIIVFVGITMFLYHYPLVKSANNPVVPMIGMVTVILIVGYELQVKQVGIPISVSNGQAYHPLYEIAPYRLATVAGGVGIAFLFTYFPSVITSRSSLRTDLGSSIYLLGHYYTSMYKTVSLRAQGTEGDPHDHRSPGRKLEKARSRVFAKELILLQGMKHHRTFISWEPTFGGKFPQETYDRLIGHTQNILQAMTVITLVSQSFQAFPPDSLSKAAPDSWLEGFKQLIASSWLASQEVTTLLSVISDAISAGKPLPPYFNAPQPVDLRQIISDLDANILSVKHVCEPGYSSFAVMQLALTMLADDLDGLLRETKTLVGEVDFSLDIVGMEDLEGDLDPISASE
ncbi:hypothetical protein AOQ84DRAFT_374763 [Glonium stellatum]|uniref:ER transporter 6TM N-terminal domain-containing protein n=1 Tax=Glonium stellatum TaxID=574774 RepID=A0A8E2JUX6_9PEZI|nr:hypothetical protein AOQ84DRAFT_374763 [Glonium stellatum]